ncbi:FAD-dependent oxidoreductase [Patescibacteria group bacterium]|nr:FAD-dependent oxidoreductase [Patescibacteria group bacterium]MBU1931364.1 FAD-dependent oxidoreductase [Patescibacteria group bacterium]
MKMYDLIIIGLGPAGLTASIYASRYKLNNLVIGKQLAGEIGLAHKVENMPGFKTISGLEWGQRTLDQIKHLGAGVITNEVGRIEKIKAGFRVYLAGDNQPDYESQALIVATGSERRRLNIPGEQEYVGKGISYCTTCDAPFFRDKTVVVIGGSDAAVSGVVHTAEFAKKVYLVYRRDQLRAEPAWLDEYQKISKAGKAEAIYNTNVVEIKGNGQRLTGVVLDKPYKNSVELNCDGVFIEIGGVPGTGLLKPLGVEINDKDFTQEAEDMSTNVPGLFVAGDITQHSNILKQAITACAQGALAAASVYKYLKKEQAPRILGV